MTMSIRELIREVSYIESAENEQQVLKELIDKYQNTRNKNVLKKVQELITTHRLLMLAPPSEKGVYIWNAFNCLICYQRQASKEELEIFHDFKDFLGEINCSKYRDIIANLEHPLIQNEIKRSLNCNIAEEKLSALELAINRAIASLSTSRYLSDYLKLGDEQTKKEKLYSIRARVLEVINGRGEAHHKLNALTFHVKEFAEIAGTPRPSEFISARKNHTSSFSMFSRTKELLEKFKTAELKCTDKKLI